MNENNMMMVPNRNAMGNRFADMGFDVSVDLTGGQLAFCSLSANNKEEKAAMFNAMNNPDVRLADCINMQIPVKDLFIEVVNCTNQETGETTACPRIVLIDESGKSYACVSIGIYGALKKAIQVFGAPTWEEPIVMEVKQISKGNRKMLTLNVVG